MNIEFDYTLDEIKKMTWFSSDSYTDNKKYHILGDFDSNTNIAYNEVKIVQERINKGYGFVETVFHVNIDADYYGEKGTSKKFVGTNLRSVKKEVIKLIEDAYNLECWVLKKTNLI